ncbi:MAG: DUF1178 family protein [Thermodesulfobacteriota bacterium]
MIAYDLQCDQGHAFEGWFDNSKSYEQQQKKGLITCPVCGSSQVQKVMSTFSIARQRGAEDGPSQPVNKVQMLIKYVQDNFEDVGGDFAKEALKMHYGVVEHRNIRGVSSSQEEETLRQEGIPFFKIPIPVSQPPEEE